MLRKDALAEVTEWRAHQHIMSTEGFLYHIATNYIHSVWDVLTSVIDEGIPVKADAEQVRRLIIDGHIGVYVGYNQKGKIDSILLLQLATFAEETVLRVIYMWGNIGERWDAYWSALKDLARHLQASAIEGFGRKGFEKWGRAEGLKPVYTLYRAEV